MDKVKQFEHFIGERPQFQIFDKTLAQGYTNYSSTFSIEYSGVNFIISIGDDALTEIICLVSTLDLERKDEILSLINDLNQIYKAAKYTYDNSGTLKLIMSYVANDDFFEPPMLFQLVSNAMAIVEEDYKKFTAFTKQ
nr:hypothetical protein [Tissierella sp.]